MSPKEKAATAKEEGDGTPPAGGTPAGDTGTSPVTDAAPPAPPAEEVPTPDPVAADAAPPADNGQLEAGGAIARGPQTD